MTRQQLLLECFPDSLDTYDRIIDSHVKNIRTKLGASGFDWIGAVRGYGYRFFWLKTLKTCKNHNSCINRTFRHPTHIPDAMPSHFLYTGAPDNESKLSE